MHLRVGGRICNVSHRPENPEARLLIAAVAASHRRDGEGGGEGMDARCARVNHGGFKWILQTPSRQVYPRRCIVLVESLRRRATSQRGYNPGAKRFRAGENARPDRRSLAERA